MNIQDVKELLAQFDQSTVNEFELKEGSFDLYMNKNKISQKSATSVTTDTINAPISNGTAVTDKVVEQVEEIVVVANSTKTTENAEEIVSPIVGIVYLQPAPDQENFKKIGDTVKKGEVVCIVEAMKLMNEITATVDGTISEILVSNEDVVEFNQPLFRVSKGE